MTPNHVLNPSNNNYTECRIKASEVKLILSSEKFKELIKKEEDENISTMASEVCNPCRKKFLAGLQRMRHTSIQK